MSWVDVRWLVTHVQAISLVLKAYRDKLLCARALRGAQVAAREIIYRYSRPIHS